jgi:FkbM family methyltransferase
MTAKQRLKYWLFTAVPGFAGRYPYHGTLVHFPKKSVVIRALCEHGLFEPEIVAWLIRLARPNSTMFDVGANLGLMSIPVLREHATTRVVSFEPSPNSLPFLRRTVAGSAYADRWTVVGKAVADRSGECDFAFGTAADALYDGLAGDQRVRDLRSGRVAVTRLDDEWQALGRPDVSVIKIDVEGAEALVLRGAHDLLKAARPAVVLEWHQHYLDRFSTTETLVAVAREFGYRIYAIPSGIPIEDNRTLQVQMTVCSNFLLLGHDLKAA